MINLQKTYEYASSDVICNIKANYAINAIVKYNRVDILEYLVSNNFRSDNVKEIIKDFPSNWQKHIVYLQDERLQIISQHTILDISNLIVEYI